MTALRAAAEIAAWAALPVAVLAAISAIEKRLQRRADRRWAEQQKATARHRTDADAWDDIVHRLTRGEPKP